jgi:hypothetical protein
LLIEKPLSSNHVWPDDQMLFDFGLKQGQVNA